MIYETGEQHEVKAEYFNEDRPGKERTVNDLYRNVEKIQPCNLRKRLPALANDHAGAYSVLTVGPARFMFTSATKSALDRA